MLQITPTASAVWPSTGQATDYQQVVWAQAKTMAEQADIIATYQTILENAQVVPPASAVGNSTGTTSLQVTSIVGQVVIGAVVSGTGVPTGMKIVAQTAGTPGGNGTYTTDVVSTLSGVTITFTPGGGNSPWPPETDSPDLLDISQRQSAILRTQNALIQQYVDLLNSSSTPVPP
jgi:galactitol-specific phosphotransferase system IIB component